MTRIRQYNSSLSVDPSKGLKRSGPIQRTKPVNRVNQRRRKLQQAKRFGEHAGWISTLACAVPDCSHRFYQRDAAHTKSRGAGGEAKHLVPLCRLHHIEQHTEGILTFQQKYGLDLDALAAELWEQSPTRRGHQQRVRTK